jgi:predicted NAD/FAD-dependent oxidoreductase
MSEHLQEILQRLRERAAGAGGSIEAHSRQELGNTVRDLEASLGPGGSAATSRATHAPRLESLAVKFEASHPALAETLRELMDALVKAGI